MVWFFFFFFFQEAQCDFFVVVIKRTPLLGMQFWLGWSCTYIFGHIICLNWLQFRPSALECLSSTCSMHPCFCCLVLESLLSSSYVLKAGPADHTVDVHKKK